MSNDSDILIYQQKDCQLGYDVGRYRIIHRFGISFVVLKYCKCCKRQDK